MSNSYTFDLNDLSNWKRHLEEQGFVVVRGVVSSEVASSRIAAMRDLLKRLSKGKLTDQEESWRRASNYPFLLHGGMAQYIGHSQFQWDSRQDMIPVFEKFWGTKDLRSSF